MEQPVRRGEDQIALSTFPYSKYSLDYTLRSLERLGGGPVELYAVEPHFHIEDCGLEELYDLKRRLRAHGLRPVCLTPEQMKYPVNIASANRAGRRRSVAMFETCIQFASELECPMALVHAGYPLNDEPGAEAWSRSAESLVQLGRRAERYGVTLVLEFVRVRWKTVLQTAEKTAEMIRAVGSPRVRAMIDTMTLAYGGETIEETLKQLRGHICHCHFSDGYTDGRRLAHLIPGEGEIDLAHMLDALSAEGYGGYLSIELAAGFEAEPEAAMKKSAEWLRTHLARSRRLS